MPLIQQIDPSTLRDFRDRADTVPCPMCEKHHAVDLVGESGMNTACWDLFVRAHTAHRSAAAVQRIQAVELEPRIRRMRTRIRH